MNQQDEQLYAGLDIEAAMDGALKILACEAMYRTNRHLRGAPLADLLHIADQNELDWHEIEDFFETYEDRIAINLRHRFACAFRAIFWASRLPPLFDEVKTLVDQSLIIAKERATR